MSPNDHPLIDSASMKDLLDNSQKLEVGMTSGSTIAYLIKGKPSLNLARKLIYFNNIEADLDFYLATSIAHRAGIMEELLQWYEKNRGWKDGGYFHTSVEPTLN